jgi:hypothetical protein
MGMRPGKGNKSRMIINKQLHSLIVILLLVIVDFIDHLSHPPVLGGICIYHAGRVPYLHRSIVHYPWPGFVQTEQVDT